MKHGARIGIGAMLLAVLAGAIVAVWTIRPRVARRWRARVCHLPRMLRNTIRPYRVPRSILPGPPRETHGAWTWQLDDSNSLLMIGLNDLDQERWRDAAGHRYSPVFVAAFSYEAGGGLRVPEVRVRVEPEGSTFAGRIEARGLKPNFAYQLKLRGVFEHRENFEAVGYAGRWRLPGRDTNYEDSDYEQHPNPEIVEAYILFDFFVTDVRGDAVRDFALDSSLHVLWQAEQRLPDSRDHFVSVIVDAGDPDLYVRTRRRPVEVRLWAERVYVRYRRADHCTTLPPGDYRAELVLTEESFHDTDPAGGHWATVALLPVTFRITGEDG